MKFTKENVLVSLMTLFIFGIGIATGLALKTSAPTPQGPMPAPAPQERPDNVRPPTSYMKGITYEQALKESKPIVLAFYVDWCGFCKKSAPVYDKIRSKYEKDINFVIVNAEDPKNKALDAEFQIKGFPSIFIVDPKKSHDPIQLDNAKLFETSSFETEIENYLHK